MSLLTNVTSALATESFVTGKNYLTALPSTANFTSLTVADKTVATQEWDNKQKTVIECAEESDEE